MSLPNYEVVDIYDNGDAYLAAVLEVAKQATQSIYVESYIFEIPDPAQEFLHILEQKHKAGLEVKVLVDGVGSLTYLDELTKWSQKSSVPLRIFNPLPWNNFWRVIFFPFFFLHLVWNTRTFNRRNHRKMVLMDGKIAFLGSINFSKTHFKAYNTIPWFDLAVQIQGHLISILEEAFLQEFYRLRPPAEVFWKNLKLTFRHKAQWFPMEHQIRLNNNIVQRFLYWRDLLNRIRNAKKRVYIMNAYFVPHVTLQQSLSFAAKKGVQVVILLPSICDVPIVKWFAPVYYRKLIRRGVEIREIQNQMIHTKSILIDDWALVGSTNLNHRSLLHDLEVEAVVDTPEMINRILAIWNEKLLKSKMIQLHEVLNLSWLSWLQYRLVLLFRYFM